MSRSDRDNHTSNNNLKIKAVESKDQLREFASFASLCSTNADVPVVVVDPRVAVVIEPSVADGTAIYVAVMSLRDDSSVLPEESRTVFAAVVVEPLQSDPAQQRSILSDVATHVKPAAQLPVSLGQHSSVMGMQPPPHDFKPWMAQNWLVASQVSPMGQQPYAPFSVGTQYCRFVQ